jgi:hypothetical protein
LSFDFGVIVLEKDLFGVLFFGFLLDFFFSLSGKTVVAELVDFLEVLEGIDFADVIFGDEVGCCLGFVVFVAEDFGVQVSVDLLDFAFAEFFDDLVLFLPEDGKVAIFGFSLKVRKMFFVKSAASEGILDLLDFAIGGEGQKLGNLFLIKIIGDDTHIQESGKVLKLKNAFGEDNGFAVINQVKLALVDDSFFESLNGVEVVSEGF